MTPSPRPARRPGGHSSVPLLLFQCQTAGLPTPQTEVRFHPTRRWRLDVAWLAQKLAIEVDGGGFVGGRHGRGLGMERDAEKLAEAAVRGWVVVKVTPRQIRSGQALRWIQQLIAAKAA